MSSVVFSVVFPIIGAVLSNVMFSSSLLVVRLSRRQRFLSKSVNPVPWAMGMVTAYVWFVYGVMVGDFFIVSSKIFGLFASTFATTSAIALLGTSRDPQEWKYIGYMEAIILISVAVWLALCYVIISTRDFELGIELVGIYAVVCSVLMYVAPMPSLFAVVAMRDASSIYTPQVIATALNNLCWLIYGFFAVNSPTVYAPSMLGLLCSIVMMAFKLIFPSKVVLEPTLLADKEDADLESGKQPLVTTAAATDVAVTRKGSVDRSRGRGESNASYASAASSNGPYIGQIAMSAKASNGVRLRVASSASAHSSTGGGAHITDTGDTRYRAYSYYRRNSVGNNNSSVPIRERRNSQLLEPATRGRTATMKCAIAPEAPPTIADMVSSRFNQTLEAVRVRAESVLQVVENSILTVAAPVLREEVVEAAVNLQELQALESQYQDDDQHAVEMGSYHNRSRDDNDDSDNNVNSNAIGIVQRIGVFSNNQTAADSSATSSPLAPIPEAPLAGVEPGDRSSIADISDSVTATDDAI